MINPTRHQIIDAKRILRNEILMLITQFQDDYGCDIDFIFSKMKDVS